MRAALMRCCLDHSPRSIRSPHSAEIRYRGRALGLRHNLSTRAHKDTRNGGSTDGQGVWEIDSTPPCSPEAGWRSRAGGLRAVCITPTSSLNSHTFAASAAKTILGRNFFGSLRQ